MDRRADTRLRILTSGERLAEIVAGLGHEAISGGDDLARLAAATERVWPDLALVRVDADAAPLLAEVVRDSACPVIAVVCGSSAEVGRAAELGVFTRVADASAPDLPGAIDDALRHFQAYTAHHGPDGGRAVIERARGILMAARAVDADRALALLALEAQDAGSTLVDMAAAVHDSHRLLLARPGLRAGAGA